MAALPLPLLLPSPGYGLRRRIGLEFERAGVPLDAVAEIEVRQLFELDDFAPSPALQRFRQIDLPAALT